MGARRSKHNGASAPKPSAHRQQQRQLFAVLCEYLAAPQRSAAMVDKVSIAQLRPIRIGRSPNLERFGPMELNDDAVGLNLDPLHGRSKLVELVASGDSESRHNAGHEGLEWRRRNPADGRL
jgi:hypothetical protein